MGKIVKTYQTFNGFTSYEATLIDGDNTFTVSFEGGTTLPYQGGKFTTSNPTIQAAIERRKDFGKRIRLIHSTEVMPEPEPVVTHDPPPPQEGHTVEGVTNFQGAKKWIADNIEGVTWAMMPNKKAVEAMMEKHRIVFPDW